MASEGQPIITPEDFPKEAVKPLGEISKSTLRPLADVSLLTAGGALMMNNDRIWQGIGILMFAAGGFDVEILHRRTIKLQESLHTLYRRIKPKQPTT